jgi:hypothetical protein
MKQHRISPHQQKAASVAADKIDIAFHWAATPDGHDYWSGVCKKLRAIDKHGTTDGKPWVEPEPEIPADYRKATAELGDDQRHDCKYWDGEKWCKREPGFFVGNILCIVPVDKAPTEENAKNCDVVMVRDEERHDWKPRRLVSIGPNCYNALGQKRNRIFTWEQARLPYPGEDIGQN